MQTALFTGSADDRDFIIGNLVDLQRMFCSSEIVHARVML